MSRIGKKPIALPSGVEVKVAGATVSVKGPLGKLDWKLGDGLGVAVENGQVVVSRSSEDRKVRALHGLVRAELNNMVHGVTKGYERNLEITGVAMGAANVMSYVAFQRPVADLNDPQELLLSIKEESQFYKRWRFGAAFLGGLRVVQQVPGFIRWICSRNRSVASAVLSCIGDPSMAIAANYPVDQNGDPVMGNLVMTDLNTAPPIRPLTHASFTTWHFSNKLRLGVRCDSTVFTQESAQELLDSFADRVLALAALPTERQTSTRVAA